MTQQITKTRHVFEGYDHSITVQVLEQVWSLRPVHRQTDSGTSQALVPAVQVHLVHKNDCYLLTINCNVHLVFNFKGLVCPPI